VSIDLGSGPTVNLRPLALSFLGNLQAKRRTAAESLSYEALGIDVVQTKDGSMHRNWRLLTQGSALGLVAAVTLLSTAIRGLAEPPHLRIESRYSARQPLK